MGTQMAFSVCQLLLSINVPLKRRLPGVFWQILDEDPEQDALIMSSQARKGTAEQRLDLLSFSLAN